MNYIKKNNQGFTLIELLVALGIMGIVISAIFSFFIFNYKTFLRADKQVEVQYEAQIAMNELIDRVIDVQKIVKIEPEIEDEQWHNINKIIFKTEYIDDHNKEWVRLIQFDYNDNSIDNKLNRGQSKRLKESNENAIISRMLNKITTNEYALNIIKFQVKLIGSPSYSGENYNECKGICVRIISTVKNTEVKLENEIYFRNWKKPQI
ncbi:prepilin-type N-terminal cleavage/methylation domain-containing protein [Lutibacter sp. B2]|nr:prepilin-type N-terminal cleavage/methylation domain-containing protein [Lutibacter sp. B2]